jgi:YegS/Rv2252/BmrU family lipid kinase
MNVHVIVNPSAACGRAVRQWPKIRGSMEHQGLVVSEYFTQGVMHATSIAVNCIERGATTIVCVGGDGTLNEIVNGLMQSGVNDCLLPNLALIPIGTGSDLARTLKIPRDHEKAIDVVAHGVNRPCDVGKVIFRGLDHQWVRYYSNVFDMGLGGQVIRIANRIPKNIGGLMTFLISSSLALVTYQRVHLRIDVDGRFIDQGLIWIVGAANGQYFGGGMHMAPMALLDDGKLEILYVKDTSIFRFITNVLGKVYEGKHLEYKNVYHIRGERLHILSEQPCLCDIDGEEEKACEVVVSIIPKAIKIKVPAI